MSLDLEKILFEFSLSMNDEDLRTVQGESPNEVALKIYLHIRKFAKKYKEKPDLLTQYKEAVEMERYELAKTLKDEITKILENGL
jgi:hypothetical protein